MKPEPRDCKGCNGTGQTNHHWNGTTYGVGPCKYCNSTGKWNAPDFEELLALVSKVDKSGKKHFRKSKPKLDEWNNKTHARAYYVWRLARFHGGADVTMPVTASLAIHNDPFHKELDAVAEALAKKVFGTDLAATYRWGNALGHSLPIPDNMPATAHACGPVTDCNKPEQELMELH